VSVYPFIEAEHAEQDGNVAMACRLLEVSRAAYYTWSKHIPSERQLSDEALAERISEIHARSRGTYGAPRIARMLRREGVCVSKKRVARLMAELGLAGRCKRRYKRTTIPDPAAQAAADLIKRVFGPGTVELDRVYVGDITYLRTWEGWAYLATVIDLASRRVVGWSIADHMETSLVSDALTMAIQARRPEPGFVFHSDRGSQYTSDEFRQLLAAHQGVQSLSRKGQCWDKGMVSYCTSWCWLGQNSAVEVAALAFDQAGVAGGGRVVEAGAAVVGLVAGEQAGAMPGLDGGGAHAEVFGDLGDGEFAGGV
jgi:transposase InsO family protein